MIAEKFPKYTLSANSEGDGWLVRRPGHLDKVDKEHVFERQILHEHLVEECNENVVLGSLTNAH